MRRGGGSGGALDARRQQMHRRRVAASAAVVACLVADVWAVAAAGAGEVPEGSFSTASRVAMTAGFAASVPLDDVERVPDSAAKPAPARPAGAAAAAAPKVVERGSGTLTVVAVPAAALGTPPTSGRTVRWTLETEGGLGVDATALATTVATVLADPRGWQTKDRVRFVNVSPAEAARRADVDLKITLASPDLTDRLCAPLQTRGQVSCHNGGRVVLNARRWLLGAEAYGTDVAAYRTYLVNHEVGHGLGHGHAYCGGAGKVAPVMMQQTYGLKGCTAWPWPTAKTA
ncbi:DUF3152 domain-containing protein [Humibacillus xanthopallidus]|uniref:DUF3152 domain-containing protein n=1 Tax=Humibacillus xanthopallidus TaxID=412689 RepID=UPI00384FE986